MHNDRHFMNPAHGRHLGAEENAQPNDTTENVADGDQPSFDVDAMAQSIAQHVREFLAQKPKEDAIPGMDEGDEDDDNNEFKL